MEIMRASELGESIEAFISTLEQTENIHLDVSQRDLVAEVYGFLQTAGSRSAGQTLEQSGFFVYGPPGRGKTWLMTQLFETAPVPAETKRRVHFHDFFRALQHQLGPTVSTRDAFDATVTELLTATQLFFLDELHVHDPGSAVLLNRLLAEIQDRKIPTLITSNYAPDSLLSDETFQYVIEPSIRILHQKFTIRLLDAGTDYRTHHERRDTGFASGYWLVSKPEDDEGEALRQAGLIPPHPSEAATVLDGHRALQATAIRGRQIWFDFNHLLESRSTTNDYLDLAREFDSWVLLKVPRLSDTDAHAGQRFVTLVDVLVERDYPLIVCAPVPRDAFADLVDPPPDLFRAMSRLALLGTSHGSSIQGARRQPEPTIKGTEMHG